MVITKFVSKFCVQETSACTNAINHVVVEACLNSSCTSTNGTVSMLPGGEWRVMATFIDLMENRKYTATLNTHYNGGVVQQSQQVEISECSLHKNQNYDQNQIIIYC